MSVSCQIVAYLKQKSRLSNTRITSYQHQGSCYDAAAKHPVQFFHSGRDSLLVICMDLRKPYWFDLRCSFFYCCGTGYLHNWFFCKCIPFVARRTLPLPFCRFIAAVLAEKNGCFCFRHIILQTRCICPGSHYCSVDAWTDTSFLLYFTVNFILSFK